MNEDTSNDHRKSRGEFPGQLESGPRAADIFFTGNPHSSLPMTNLGDVGTSYYPADDCIPTHDNMKDLVLEAVNGKMPDKLWEGQIFNHYPPHLKPSANITTPQKMRSINKTESREAFSKKTLQDQLLWIHDQLIELQRMK